MSNNLRLDSDAPKAARQARVVPTRIVRLHNSYFRHAKGEQEMKPLGGFTQNELNALWASLNSNKPNSSVQKIVDDEVEQVMTITTPEGTFSISRRSGAEWFATPSVGDRGVS